jgi:hypothetical protein
MIAAADKQILECWIYDQGIKDEYSDSYGLNCKGENTDIAKGYNWALSKVLPCILTFEEECKIQHFIDKLKKDYICELKKSCGEDLTCSMTITIIEPTRNSCRLSISVS